MIIDNRAGAGGTVGAEIVYRAEPDGYTLLCSPPGPLSINHNLYKTLPYDWTKFVPIGVLALVPNVITARIDLPASSLPEFIAWAKANPGKATYASQGNGSTSHLSASNLATLAGIELVHVPYKGSAGAVQDLLGGQIPYMFLPVHVAATYIKSGKLKALAIGSAKRHPLLPDVPTLIELGLKDANVDMWYGLFAPKDTPDEIVARLDKELAAILDSDEAREAFGKQGLTPATSTPAELAEIVKRDRDRWADIIAKRGIKAE